jgi:phosphoserine aminotransferase
MYNFYPGPSKIYPEVRSFMLEAFDSGILEMNHRSDSFMALLKSTIEKLKLKMNIPVDYEVYLTSSATECWEIVCQSVLQGKVQFAYNGAFGKKWFKYTVINPNPTNETLPFDIRGSRFSLDQTLSDIDIDAEYDCFCAVQNETSNGTFINNETLSALPGSLLKCFDVTSSLGGQAIDFSFGDIFLASVQKCLGLPSGLGVLICSPKALEQARSNNEWNHYNSLLFIQENFKKYQTHYTPNILNIYLLDRLLSNLEDIDQISQKLASRADKTYAVLDNASYLTPLVQNVTTRSPTVLSVCGSEEIISKIKRDALNKNILLGNGYGEWGVQSFRIANFPAIPDEDFDVLNQFLSNY